MSLKDPVSMSRIKTPCRTTNCRHTECFDAEDFLQLQEQAPTWTCPICSKPAQWEHLVVDRFVQHILENTKRDTEQVTIEPNGTWHLLKSEDDDQPESERRPPDNNDSDDDDDLVVIDPETMTSSRPRYSTDTLFGTPVASSISFNIPHRQNSQSQPAYSQSPTVSQHQPPSQSKKRPREEVIDLTLSDDDEPPVSRIKRPSLSSQVSTDLNRPNAFSGQYRFNLPAPVQRTDSPGHYYEFDQLRTAFQ